MVECERLGHPVYNCSRDAKRPEVLPEPMRVVVRELFETTLLALLIFLLLHVSIGNRRVDGPSMNPTLVHGQRVIVNKLSYLSFSADGPIGRLPFVDAGGDVRLYAFEPPGKGDVVVFRSLYEADRDLVKRVIAVPGETVEIRDGSVFVDGVELDEPYAIGRDRWDMRPLTVPDGAYFVLGDNRQASNDSRSFGVVPVEHIIGKAWLSVWPPDKFEILRVLPLP